MRTRRFLEENAAIIFLCLAAAFVCHVIFVYIHGDLPAQIPAWHAAHMAGQSMAPLQYRVLSFLLPEWMARSGMNIVHAYLLLRFAGLALAFWFAALIMRELVERPSAPAVMVVALGYFYVSTIRAHMQPAEEPNLLIFALFIWLVLREAHIGWLAMVMAVGVLNKDTVGFLIPFLFFYRWASGRGVWITLRDSAILSVIFLAGYLYLRIHYGTDRPYLGGFWQAGYNFNFMVNRPVPGSFWLLPSLLPLAVLLARWNRVPLAARCFVPSLLLFVIGHWLISRIDEFRTYTPLALLMWPAVLATFWPRKVGPVPAYTGSRG